MMEITIDEIFQMNQIKYNTTFEPLCTLASGAFGTVIKAKEKNTNRLVAVKRISKEKSHKNAIVQLKREVTVLQKTNHSNIVKLYDFFETENEVYIVMEYLQGGTLKQYIESNKETITENQSKEIIFYLLQAVEHLHKLDICHRDIKPENIMFDDSNDLSTLKLIDFGFSTQLKKEEGEFCGTIKYMAPERLTGEAYDKVIDIWSIGIIMYMLLNNGKHPFYAKGDSADAYFTKCRSHRVKMINHVSREAKSLLGHLIEINQNLRYTASFALQHKWFKDLNILSLGSSSDSIEDESLLKKKSIEMLMALMFLSHYKNEAKPHIEKKGSISTDKNSNHSTEDDTKVSQYTNANLFLHTKHPTINVKLHLNCNNNMRSSHVRFKTNINHRNSPLLSLSNKEDDINTLDSPSEKKKIKLVLRTNTEKSHPHLLSTPVASITPKKSETIRNYKEKSKTIMTDHSKISVFTFNRAHLKSKTSKVQRNDEEIVARYLELNTQYKSTKSNYNVCHSTKNNNKHFVLPLITKERSIKTNSINKSLL